jgi:hypothetical protein
MGSSSRGSEHRPVAAHLKSIEKIDNTLAMKKSFSAGNRLLVYAAFGKDPNRLNCLAF